MSGAVEMRSSQGSPDAPRACLVCGSHKLGPRFCTECGTELVPPVIVTHAVGPMWAVNGHVLTVATGEDLRRTILDTAAGIAQAAAPVRVVVTDGSRVTRVVLRLDGSSVAEGDDAAAWAGPGVQPVTPPRSRPSLVGVHAGAGASTWALLLDLPEAQLTDEPTGPVVLVCRSTPAGINATKAAVHALGTDAVDAVLVVADAPGKPVPAAAREQRVLAGAVSVVPVPWLPRLRAVAEISPALVGQLTRPVQRVTKALQGAQTAKKEKA
ncbi:hypothetical protein NY551_18325 [Curtobacterium flaccumfaciens pv. oortii]|uniref:hypothetical protein n=1 Tax=Curtobacterium flaccumfaciens TaxID=2035 RepID=UPI00265B1D11|nr:hypothetical protein [Curtobacterium flaccumfaciens]MCS5524694.1 hypothetical protein [Curtobacterium flaccumfaciens pv. oortii]